MGLSVSIQQPEHIPWAGFFHKMDVCDVTVYFDTVQFKKRYFENRNRIRTRSGWQWLTVPVKTRGRFTQRIADVTLCEDAPWRRKYLAALRHNYSHAPYFNEIFPAVRDILDKRQTLLTELNIDLIECVRAYLGIGGRTVRASRLPAFSTSSTSLLLDLCRHLGATEYVCGMSGPDYMDMDLFKNAGIRVRTLRYAVPEYPQAFSGFEAGMSILDAMFNLGPEALAVVRQNALTQEARQEEQ